MSRTKPSSQGLHCRYCYVLYAWCFVGIALLGSVLSDSSLPDNAGVVYPLSVGQLSFCSQINYTAYFEITKQSSTNSSHTYDTPVIELPTGTIVPLNPDGAHLATTDNIFEEGYYEDSNEFNETIINIDLVDQDAREMYERVEGILERYNCRDFYPYHSCDPCLYYYKNWICAISFPMWNETAPHKADSVKMCDDVCWEVVRKCPVELDFYCPTHDDTFGEAGSCNNLGLNSTSSAHQFLPFGMAYNGPVMSFKGIGSLLQLAALPLATLLSVHWLSR